MTRRRAAAAALMLAMAAGGCTHVTQLRNDRTGQTATCGGEMVSPTSSERDAHCLKIFHENGFDPVPESPK